MLCVIIDIKKIISYLPESSIVEKETARQFTSTVYSTTTENVSKTKSNGWNWRNVMYGGIAAGSLVATVYLCNCCSIIG